ncbi:piggyBac transposable element-derived protein 4-like [Maniola jurtina]|nr:piggyBac transposable element-derived protein 4-like [Maniola jurtina]
MSAGNVEAQLAEMFADTGSSSPDEEASSSSSEEETSSDQSTSQAEEGWTEAGSLQEFPFSNIGHFNIGPAESPIDFFNLFFNSTFMSLLIASINSHGLRLLLETNAPHSRALNWKDTNADEVLVFLAMLIHMGHIRLSRLNDYWSTDPLYNLPFKNFMSRDRFLLILRNLFFSDPNYSFSNNDPNRFVKPIITFFNNLMKTLVSPPKNLTIDESVLHWRGRLKIRQYIKGKRHKYGVKIYVLTDTNGITQKMHMYCGSHDDELQGKGHADKVVMMLMEDYLDAGHSLYMDNFYNSVKLAENLLAKRTYLTGTLRANRVGNPIITRTKIARGTLLTRYRRGVCVTNYRDKRNVLMISTEHHSNLVDSRNRRGQVSQKPKVIVSYNKFMKGVDRKDQMLSYYPFYTKSTRWYRKMLLHVMQVMLLNSYLMFNQQMKYSGNNDKVMSFLDFRLNVIRKLLKIDRLPPTDRQTAIRNMPTSSTVNKIKTNTGDDIHLPEELPKNHKGKTKRKDCRHCMDTTGKRKSTLFYCPLCSKRPGLCLKCFRVYHRY